jgi:hypothetical protein
MTKHEEFAFYESGLSAHGCLENLDDYAKEAIHRYGRILLEKQKENFINGFQGCCYTCEPVGILNKKLEEQLKAIEEDGTEEHNNAVELRMKLAETLVQNDELKKLARKLYGIAIHLQAISSDKPIAVIGNSFYQELVDAIKEYEELHV